MYNIVKEEYKIGKDKYGDNFIYLHREVRIFGFHRTSVKKVIPIGCFTASCNKEEIKVFLNLVNSSLAY